MTVDGLALVLLVIIELLFSKLTLELFVSLFIMFAGLSTLFSRFLLSFDKLLSLLGSPECV